MPGMDGFEVLGTLNEQGNDIPVIVLTADIQETARKKCIRMGAFDFLNKPPNDDELNAAVEKALAFKEERAS
jgi:CheY-like chemotaxis protein